MKKAALFMLSAGLFLAACNGSDKKDTAENTPVQDQTLPAAAVADYVAAFEKQQQDVRFDFAGASYDLQLDQPDTEKKLLSLAFEKGTVVLGFDFKKWSPTGKITIKLLVEDQQQAAAENDQEQQTVDLVTGDNLKFTKEGSNYKFVGQFATSDGSKQYDLDFVFNGSIVSKGTTELFKRPELGIAVLEGELGVSSYQQVKAMTEQFPQITQLVLADVPGSVDDKINVHTGRLIRKAGITTIVPASGEIASGGVDLFLAGKQRVYYRGGKVGVHSWCCIDGKSADQAPRDSKQHQSLIEYSQEMLGDELGKAFYFFTIDAAPFTSVHNMTETELLKFIVPEISVADPELI